MNLNVLHSFLLFILSVFILSCGVKEKTAPDEDEKKTGTDSSETTIKEISEADSLPFGLKLFTNMEMVPYCIPLPLTEYRMDADQSDEKAKFIFTKNTNPDFYIAITGLLRSDESVTLDDYYLNSVSEEETEAQGKILDQKVLLKDKGCFWVTGYWSNFPDQKFVELTFLRKEDVVIIYWSYDHETESSLYFKILQEWIRHGSECKE